MDGPPYFARAISYARKMFMKLNTDVRRGFKNLPGTNTLVYFAPEWVTI